MSSLGELIEEINIDKEILSTLPQNNKRNTKIYADKVEELLQKYKSYEIDLLKEIEKRSKRFDNVVVSDKIDFLKNELENIEKYLGLIEENNSAYEKMGLDREISSLTYYYKKDLKKVNDTIRFALNKFNETGIKVTPDDFIFNKYVKEYVSAVISNKDEEVLNAKFEEIYWKCPEIITYIEINIRSIYFKNLKLIDKYYKNLKEKILKIFPQDTIESKFLEIKKSSIEAYKSDLYLILNKFLKGTLLVKDYKRESIVETIKKTIGRTDLNSVSDEELEKLLLNLIKYLNTLIEYQNYNKFKFIVDKVKTICDEKDKYKDVYSKTKKEIDKLEAKVIKLGKTGLFNKDSDKNLTKQTELIKELQEKYKELDINEAYEKIANVLDDQSTLYDALKIASLYYRYLFKCIIENEADIQEEGINQIVDELKDFVNWPYFTILNNIKLSDQKNIMLIIKDRYNLLNMNVSRDDLAVDNVETVINTLKKCETYYYIMKNNIDLQVVSETYEFKKILNNL